MTYAVFFAVFAVIFLFLWLRSDFHRSNLEEFVNTVIADLEKAKFKSDIRKVVEDIKTHLNG